MPTRGKTRPRARPPRRPSALGRLIENAIRIRRDLPLLRKPEGRERLYRQLKKSASRPRLAHDLKEIRSAVELLSGAGQLRPEVSDPDLFRVGTGFNQVRVDLSDVVGSPGLPKAGELAERASGAFKGAFRQAPRVDQPFLFGEAKERLKGGPKAQVSSFVGRLDRALPDHELRPEDLKLLVARTSATGSHLVVQQTVQDAEVVGARFQLHVGRDGRPYGLTGRPVGDLRARKPGTPPRRSHAEAIEALRSALGLSRSVRVALKRVVFPLPDGCVWAYEARFVSFVPAVADVRAYLRADDLSLLASVNIAAALRGEANAFPVNPSRTTDTIPVRLDHIGPIPSNALSGSVAHVEPRTGKPFRSATRDFRLMPGETGFDEANAYYHLCKALRYFGDLLDPSLLRAAPFAPIRAVVRDSQSPSNAYFLPSTGELLFGDFGPRPSARSADIIYHELGHAVSDTICRLGRGLQDCPARGMSEGYSDYFQASALDDPRIGDYVTNNLAGHRNLSRAGLRFEDGCAGEEHATGEVWGSILWSIRAIAGAGVADMIVAESLQFLNPNASFDEGLAALLQADARLFPRSVGAGRHSGVIKQEFDRRRPRAGAQPTPVKRSSSPMRSQTASGAVSPLRTVNVLR